MKKILLLELKLLSSLAGIAIVCLIFGVVIPSLLTFVHYAFFGFSMEYTETIFRFYQVPFICVLIIQTYRRFIVPLCHLIQQDLKDS